MKKVSIFVSVLIVLALILTACQQAVETPAVTVPTEAAAQPETAAVSYARNETIYVTGAAWGPPTSWNPYQPGVLANTTGTIGILYETLFNYDPLAAEMIPFLAESGTWTDANTFDIVLRSGLTWSDGEPLTAADIVYSFELGKQYSAMWFAPLWNYLTEIKAVDDTHVQMKFEDPLYQEFSNHLYNIPIVPKHLWEGRDEAAITSGANENPVGSGAYLFSSSDADRNVWQRNDSWWGTSVFGAPAPKYIVEIHTSGNNVALGMVLKGELDLSNNFLPGIAEMSANGYAQTYYPSEPYMLSANTAVLFLNTTKKPMDDPAFRRALAYSINTDDIVKYAYAGLVKAANPTGLLPTLDKYVDKDVVERVGFHYDPEETAKILAEAGYKDTDGDGFVEAPDGSKIALEVTCPTGWTDWMAAINVIAQSAQAAGINLQAVTPDYNAWNNSVLNATFDMTLNNWANLSNTPWTLYNLLFNHPLRDVMQSGNFGKYDNQQMFDLVDNLARVSVTDDEGMKAACSEIQELMLTDLPILPLWYNGAWAQFSSRYWTNWPSSADGAKHYFPVTWNGYWNMTSILMLTELKPAAQ